MSVSGSAGRRFKSRRCYFLRRVITLSKLFTRIYLGQLSLSSLWVDKLVPTTPRMLSPTYGCRELACTAKRMQLKANLMISYSPEVAACAAISASVISLCLLRVSVRVAIEKRKL